MNAINPFESIESSELAEVAGGVTMKLTQFGYPEDPYMDSYTKKGQGAYRNLEAGESIAMTDSGLAALGLSGTAVRRSERWVEIRPRGGGNLQPIRRRIDDRAPQGDYRADLYMPGGFDKRLPDYADVRLVR